jgi:hypothetical protein
MGYTTEFEGSFTISPTIKPEHAVYLNRFAETRRMQRDSSILQSEEFPDPIRESIGLPIGIDGEYFVGGGGLVGQERDRSIVDYNKPPRTQPELWCQWIVTKTQGGTDVLVWDGGEKFYAYIEWLEYLIEHFFKPWGYTLNGSVEWQGEGVNDFGEIFVTDNVVRIISGNWF